MAGRGNWSKKDLKVIWLDYVENKIYKIFNDDFRDWDLKQEAPCPGRSCGKRMLRAAYIGYQTNEVNHSYDIDHINGNPKIDELYNLQPMHPICNKKKK